MTLFHIQHYNI